MKTLKQQNEEAMREFEEAFPPEKSASVSKEMVVLDHIKSFLHHRYIIAAEQRIEEIKSEIARVEGMKRPEEGFGGEDSDVGYNQALSDYLLHLQSKLAAAEKELSEIKI